MPEFPPPLRILVVEGIRPVKYMGPSRGRLRQVQMDGSALALIRGPAMGKEIGQFREVTLG